MISLEEVLQLHELSIRDFGGKEGIRDLGLLESAITRPYQTYNNLELYPSVFSKAAALIESVVKNHPFIDGNKRTGFLVTFVFLYRSQYELTSSEQGAYEFVMKIASSEISFEEIVNWLKQHSSTI